ncbi:MAG: hypothetical protein CVV49_10010 [Spirochaetae bacterium HGW-Spirochaetae-5]|nr:MAG: hypothetical protein CVV49_10010 [Spirochaetae bacterium HGW-Spirochaetae-5]
MKYIKLIILAAFLSTMFTGCSYVSDMVEGRISDRASFTASAVYSGGNVTLTWDRTDSDPDFTGIEISRTKNPNNEFETYEVVATRLTDGVLANGLNTTYTISAGLPSAVSPGEVYFYRVAFIYWDNPADERIPGTNGYTAVDADNYNNKTNIEAISGYAKVVIQ